MLQDGPLLGPALELVDACPQVERGVLPVPYNLTLAPGECALIECRDPVQSTFFTDFCAGQVPVGSGTIRCLGLAWKDLDAVRTDALRGCIGRLTLNKGWVDFSPMQMNILWPGLYHTYTPLQELVDAAVRLCIDFGLPGLPTVYPTRMSAVDRQRAALVRAFLNGPSLLLLEEPVQPMDDFYDAFIMQLTAARDRGCAVVWISSGREVWQDYIQPGMQQFRLSDGGLVSVRR
ncbi:ABC transporter ATP-binding protein [Formicincola oecophyllae]|uniref:ABC transporter ATP-binding protein n=1 Tax=Formicincola oecophyllae TaxID=2558361 RepID=A0A4Y6UCY1_9PROT|nr:ABC transporter ATP-binding protein [Formicincola oecophyllae]